MAIHIWCPRPSNSARLLREALLEAGVKAYKSRSGATERQILRFVGRVVAEDLWINWGPPPPQPSHCCSLNATPWINKRAQLITLAQAGLPCPEVFDSPGIDRIGRAFRHQGGKDILEGYGRDYYTQKLSILSEVRVHVFRGLSIRAGLKVTRPDFENPHPWVRTFNAGWKIDYALAPQVPTGARALAKKAVTALQLDFGAVDIGVASNGRLAVLEVNTAPGLDAGPSVDAYVRQILKIHSA